MSFDIIDAEFYWFSAPELVVTPTLLDFGKLKGKGKEVREFYVSHKNDPVYRCSFACSDPWVRVVDIQPTEGDKPALVRVVVEVDSRSLLLGQHYTGWIEATINEVKTRIPLSVAIREERSARRKRRRWLRLLLTTLLAVSLIGGCLAFLFSVQVNALTEQFLTGLFAVHPRPVPNVLSFSAYEGQTAKLYVTEGATAQPQTLAVAGWSPVWSPDGTQLAFISDKSGAPQLYVMQATGEWPTQLTKSAEAKFAPAWSPDGTKLAFIVGQPGQGMLRVVNSYTMARESATPSFASRGSLITAVNTLFGRSKQSNQLPGFTQHFAWSPSGHSLLLDYYQNNQVWIIQVGVTGAVSVVAVDSWDPAWSPDGNEIVAVSAQGLYRIAIDGDERYYLSDRQVKAPAWSPSGAQIAFLSAQATDSNTSNPQTALFDLWLMDTAGGNETLLATGCVSFAWSPDGKQLAYVTGDSQAPSPLLYLWRMTPGEKPLLVAEINTPFIAWKPLP